MSKTLDLHYIPGSKLQNNRPLERYFPPIRTGVASNWLDTHIPKGSLLLDPFGSSPDLVIEAAKLGYSVIVTANNPVTRFVFEILSNPPSRSEFQSAIALLASLQVGDERLEPHIKSNYETICTQCNRPVQATAFLWKRNESVPYARIYDCPNCGESGEHLTTSYDTEKALMFSRSGLHRARALERVAPLHDPDRHHVQEALEVYLPRAIYSLVTIINKLNSISKTESNYRILSALLLLVFDRSNTLWLYPKERQRPRQLTVPTQFREYNIWLAMESAVDLWSTSDTSIPISTWPEIPRTSGGISLFEGRIKELAAYLSDINVSAVFTAFPRPNQAFWTLSALWSGWLWGHEAVEHFKSVLRRRRYDWAWHANAIRSALSSLVGGLPDKTPFFGLINELEPGFLTAVLLGSQLPNLHLRGLALRDEDGQAQLTWEKVLSVNSYNENIENIETLIFESIIKYLRELRGEPSPYIYLLAASLMDLVKKRINHDAISPSGYLNHIQSTYRNALTIKNRLIQTGGSGKSLEVGRWWVKDVLPVILPLADRVEISLVNYLLSNPSCTFTEIDMALCQIFPGISPPGFDIIQMCLDSYGKEDPAASNLWSIRDGDSPTERRKDIKEMENILFDLGKRLGFECIPNEKTPSSLYWINTDSQIMYTFFISASAILGKYLIKNCQQLGKLLIILPGSRSNLVLFKLKQDNHLKEIVDDGWQFIKYRHLRQLAESSTLNIANLEEQLYLDPLTYSEPQIRLL